MKCLYCQAKMTKRTTTFHIDRKDCHLPAVRRTVFRRGRSGRDPGPDSIFGKKDSSACADAMTAFRRRERWGHKQSTGVGPQRIVRVVTFFIAPRPV
jgi:hypothetical protein